MRHEDPQAVWAACAAAGGCPALITGTPTEGWCSVYPKDARALKRLAQPMSDTLGALVLGLEVYDSDACEIALYNSGKLVTRFKNEYEDQPGQPGNAAKFAKYARDHDEVGIQAILDLAPVFAEDFAVGIAAYFGIPRERAECGFRWKDAAAQALEGLVLAEASD